MVKKVYDIDTTGLEEKADYDNKITDIAGKIPSIIALANAVALNDVKNEIPNVNNLVKQNRS